MTSRSTPSRPAPASGWATRSPALRTLGALAACLGLAGAVAAQPIVLPAAPAGVQTFTDQGIQFSRVRADNVVPFVPTNGNIGRPIGAGSWDFGLSRTEVTQGQWIEFINAFNDVPIPAGRSWSGAMTTLLNGSGLSAGTYGTFVGPQGRFAYAATELGARLPAQGMGWYGSAVYCNWLQNARVATLDALNNGAYDLRGWNQLEPSTWPGVTRQPWAQYWIPTYDEWAVSSFYDLNRYGPDSPGWWSHLNRLDRNPIPGTPGVGETSAGWLPPGPGGAIDAFLLPVASYPGSLSPWGLLDTSGSYFELLEDSSEYDRLFAGTLAGPFNFPELNVLAEQPGWVGGESPNSGGTTSLRIATFTVPAPSGAIVMASLFGCLAHRRRRM